MLSAVFVFVRDDALALMEQRPDLDSHYPNEWLFPGGKLEADEWPCDAMLREAREALRLCGPATLPGEVREL